MRLLVTVTCDWSSGDMDDQFGRVLMESDTGKISASWSCEGGKGKGAELLENDTDYSDELWDEVLDSPDLYQGFGTYSVDLNFNGSGLPVIENVCWASAADS